MLATMKERLTESEYHMLRCALRVRADDMEDRGLGDDAHRLRSLVTKLLKMEDGEG